MELKGTGRVLCADMEACGLLPDIRKNDRTSLHCLVCQDAATGQVFKFFDDFDDRDPDNREWLDAEGEQDGTLEEGVKFLRSATLIIMQNSTGFDYLGFELVFGKLWHRDYTKRINHPLFPYKHADTFVMSTLLNPERKPPREAYEMGLNITGHSIQSHGIRMGRHKPDNKDWTKLTDHMLHRCAEDVAIGLDFFFYLKKEWDKQKLTPSSYTKLSIVDAYGYDLQGHIIVARQGYRGFPVHVPTVVNTVNSLKIECDSVEAGLRDHMPKRLKRKPLTLAERQQLVEIEHGMFEGECEETMQEMDSDGVPTHGSNLKTVYGLTTAKGIYKACVTKLFPELRGKPQDHDNPVVQGDYCPLTWEDIPMGNRVEVAKIMYKQGWRGVNYNDREQGLIDAERTDELDPWSGKIDEKSLEMWKEREEIPKWCEDVAKWYILRMRQSMLLNLEDIYIYEQKGAWPQKGGKDRCRGILPQCFNPVSRETAKEYFERTGAWPLEGDWRAPAIAFYNATNTFRMRHKTVVNIPKKGVSPLRHVFIGTIDKYILGCDGSGIELRMLAHFMADEEYIEVLLKGDIHTHNQLKAGLSTRDVAKIFIYAFLYGSGIFNLSKICDCSEASMAKTLAKFKRELPALKHLIEGAQAAGERNRYLLSLDGRRGRIRYKDGKLLVHTILNVLLQMTASLCMKYSKIIADNRMRKEGVSVDEDGEPEWIADVHDEFQTLVLKSETLEKIYEVESWKEEKKREEIDDSNRMWSAPVLLESRDVVVTNKDTMDRHTVTLYKCSRRYHKAGQIIAESMAAAGEVFNLRLPLAGEYKIGNNWSETH